MTGESAEEPLVVNLKDPNGMKTLTTETGEKLKIDAKKMAAAADKLGADKYDVLSIGGYRNAKGEFVPDYDSVRIESRNNPGLKSV